MTHETLGDRVRRGIVTVAVDMVAVRRGAAGELAAARQQDAIR
jgi:hypothetical protein